MDNTIKLRVILLCFVFAIFGYIVGNFNILKERFCTLGGTASVTTSAETSIYEVKKEDTLDTIARLFGVSKEALIKENKIIKENLPVGTLLTIPKKETVQ